MRRDDEVTTRSRTVLWLVLLLLALAALLAFEVYLGLRPSGSAPPVPVIRSVGLPTNPTRQTSARFVFTDPESVTFECALGASPFVTCGSGYLGSRSYAGPLRSGPHVFRVRARVGATTSAAASYAWTILTPSASGSIAAGASAPVDISGHVGGLAPGMTKEIEVTFTNPNGVPIYVTDLNVEIAPESTPSGCSSAENMVLHQATGITKEIPVAVPAGGSATVTTYPQAPEISFANLHTNQDVCKEKHFTLTFTGSAHS